MENLDGLLEKIQREGVEKAQAEATKIVAEAKAQAEALVAEAEAKAKVFQQKAEADAAQRLASGQATLRQAARDVMLGIEKNVEALFTKLLVQDVNQSLGDGDVVAKLAAEAIETYAKSGKSLEVVAGPVLLNALRERLAKMKEITLTMNEMTGAGFRVRIDGGRVEHDFTGEAVAEALAGLLRPQLAELLK